MANIELDGSNKTIKVDTGDLTLDVPGEIHFDADGAIIRFKDNGTAIGTFENVSSDFIIKSSVSDKDLIFKGNDGGSAVTALTLDMSDAGKATFNSNIVVSSTVLGASDLNLSSSDSNEKITLDRSGTQRFNVGGSEGMRLTTTGLGIGTSSPLGRIHAKQHSTAYGLVMEANGNDSWLRVHHNDSLGIIETTYNSSAGYSPLTFKTSATERMRIDSSGNVGIGETAPLGNLHVKSADSGADVEASKDELVIEGSANSGMTILSGASSQGAIAFGDSGDNDIGRFTYSHSDNSLRVHTSGSEAIRIDSSQQVGIGTTSPAGKLHVESDAGGVKLLTRGASSSTTTSNDADELFVDNTGNSGITIGSGTSSLGSIHFGDSGDNDIGKIVYDHSDNSLAFTTNASERMTITSTGATTITTGDNSDTLTLISTDADANAGPILVLNRDSSSPADSDYLGAVVFRADDDGGNATDFLKIEAQIQDASNGAEGTIARFLSMKEGTARQYISFTETEIILNQDSVDLDFRVESNGNENMIFVEGGTNRVGVGLSSPQHTFHVDGEIASSDTSVDADTSKYLSIQGNGNTAFINHTGSGDLTFRMGSGFATAMTVRSSGLAIGGTGDANTLDDYEEGTHTVTLTDTTGNASSITLNSSYNQISYRKVGSLVHVQGVIVVTGMVGSFSDSGGRVRFSLPFTAADLQDQSGKGHVGVGVYNVNFTAGTAPYFITIEGQAYMEMQVSQDNGGGGNGQLSTSSQIYVGGTFISS